MCVLHATVIQTFWWIFWWWLAPSNSLVLALHSPSLTIMHTSYLYVLIWITQRKICPFKSQLPALRTLTLGHQCSLFIPGAEVTVQNLQAWCQCKPMVLWFMMGNVSSLVNMTNQVTAVVQNVRDNYGLLYPPAHTCTINVTSGGTIQGTWQ